MPRTFNGSTDILQLGDPSTVNPGAAPLVVAMICYPTAVASGSAYFLCRSKANTTFAGFKFGYEFSPSGRLKFGTSASGTFDAPSLAVASNKWYLVGVYYTTGNIRFFLYDYATDTFSAENTAATLNFGTTADTLQLASLLDSSTQQQRYTGDIEVAAIWQTPSQAPSDDQLHNLAFDKEAWYEFSTPSCMWLLDQQNVSQLIVDEIGAANQSSITGTAVSTRSVPIWTPGNAAMALVGAPATNNFVDAATITSSTTPSSTDTADYVETGTVSGVTTPSGVEAGSATTDAATLTSVTQPSSVETTDFVDAATLTSVTFPSGSEGVPFVDADTPSIITEITAGEYNFTHPTGSWGVADTDDGVI